MTRHRPSRRDMILAALTGALAANSATAQQSQGPGDNGIGGTGLPRRAGDGIGGTGVYGAISGFGSIIVNGVRVAYGADATVLADGRTLKASALRIGHVVRVAATGPRDGLRTQRIVLDRIVIGPVSRSHWLSGGIEVLGQRVLAPKGADRPAVGDWVAVSGFRRPDGVIEASLIEPTDERIARVTGTPVARGAGGGLMIGDLPLDLAARHAGRRVRIAGDIIAGRMVVRRVAAAPVAPAGDRVLVQGYAVRSGDRLQFADSGFSALLPASLRSAALNGRMVLVAEKDAQESFVAVSISDSGGLGGQDAAPQQTAPGGRAGPGAREGASSPQSGPAGASGPGGGRTGGGGPGEGGRSGPGGPGSSGAGGQGPAR